MLLARINLDFAGQHSTRRPKSCSSNCILKSVIIILKFVALRFAWIRYNKDENIDNDYGGSVGVARPNWDSMVSPFDSRSMWKILDCPRSLIFRLICLGSVAPKLMRRNFASKASKPSSRRPKRMMLLNKPSRLFSHSRKQVRVIIFASVAPASLGQPSGNSQFPSMHDFADTFLFVLRWLGWVITWHWR